MPLIDRRGFLVGGLATAAIWRPLGSARAENFKTDPFALGVASGAPRADSVVLWTRLILEDTSAATSADPFAPAPKPVLDPIDVEWMVAEDEAFSKPVQSGLFRAVPEFAHSMHVEVTGLSPGRWYFYRFRSGNAESPVGRTRTSPADSVDTLRLAFASCQQYEQGFYSAYADMAGRDLDLVIHLGDYIYERSYGAQLVRKHQTGVPSMLYEFRDRYALYKSDPLLQAAHAAFPWLAVWDDHEVTNNYANDRAPDAPNPAEFLARRRAAYQAWFEHMPVHPSLAAGFDALRIYDHYSFGNLAGVTLLDTRQYRSPQLGGSVGDDRPERTMLGPAQETWLGKTLGASQAKWNIIAQQTLLAERDTKAGPATGYNLDGWDGYRAARGRLLEAVQTSAVENPLIIGGDLHAFYAADVKRDFADEKAQAIASEFVCGSITSDAPSQASLATALAENPHLKFASDKHGYAIMRLSERSAEVDFIGIAHRKQQNSPTAVFQSFAVADGAAGVNRL
ncbi:alkaline phosphatase [Neorhizobium galegae]|uniref:alkaline phosphatase D family protein n=1 Tax=Neorhizobium galegae TaxID=399 RepID=UPI000620FDA0|nr:alkaline phosphatase D family protein [Neorhizobium galegae]CDZ28958.1 Alkaline phosphatase [Neorhizobium galegae bv. officinalis]KAA9385395.1 alkaline phosphatase [Neorhizobium galegae]KAB1113136.1 alkaline phosphatase [Neorhizobium galegae]MCM2499390.1 alkaline phosphatase D family protein [Neorhizobium galegae]MCQ1773957.1 alkaline phosphatase D family protein [Neorhizobium galegae]